VSRITSFCEWLLRRSSVWGGMACFAFYAIVVQSLDRTSASYSWFAGEAAPLKAFIALVFCTAMARLALRLLKLGVELAAVHRPLLPEATAEVESDDAGRLLAELELAPISLRDSCLARRFLGALSHLERTGSTDSLPAQLSYLADVDRRALGERYFAVRALAVLVVMLGVVGGIVGGGAALASYSGGDSEGLIRGARLALDVAGLATVAATLMTLARIAVQCVESRLLVAADQESARQLLGRFRASSVTGDPSGAGVVRLCEKVLETVNSAIARHEAALGKATTAASRRWEESASAAAALVHRTVGEALTAGLREHAQALNDGVAKHAQNLEGVLIRHAEILSENVDQHSTALAESLEHHSAIVVQTETRLADENRQHLAELEGALGEAVLVAADRQEKLIQQSETLLREMQTMLVEASGATVAQQQQLMRQGEILLRVVEGAGHIRKLEDALNSNLASLASAHHFEDTVVGLSAALQLLSANLGRSLLLRDEFSFAADEPASQAA
jgi:hypothetical protein